MEGMSDTRRYSNILLQAMFGNGTLFKALRVTNPWTNASLKILFKTVKECKVSYLPIAWIAYDTDFTSNAMEV